MDTTLNNYKGSVYPNTLHFQSQATTCYSVYTFGGRAVLCEEKEFCYFSLSR